MERRVAQSVDVALRIAACISLAYLVRKVLTYQAVFDALMNFVAMGAIPGTAIRLTPGQTVASVAGLCGVLVLPFVVVRLYRRKAKAVAASAPVVAKPAAHAPVAAQKTPTPRKNKTVRSKPRALPAFVGRYSVLAPGVSALTARVTALFAVVAGRVKWTRHFMGIVWLRLRYWLLPQVARARRTLLQSARYAALQSRQAYDASLTAAHQYWQWQHPYLQQFDAWLALQCHRLVERLADKEWFSMLVEFVRGMVRAVRR